MLKNLKKKFKKKFHSKFERIKNKFKRRKKKHLTLTKSNVFGSGSSGDDYH
jgi:hypothetical protein